MNLPDLTARIRRLEELSRGLAIEGSRWRKDHGLLLFTEAHAYFQAILDALAGVEKARVVLAQVQERVEEVRPPEHLSGA